MSKKQTYLSCDAGVSISITVSKMVEVVEKHQIPLMITAFPIARAQEVVKVEKLVAILSGSQVRFLLEKTKGQFAPQGIPVAAIVPEIYGMMDGERVSKGALRLIKQNRR